MPMSEKILFTCMVQNLEECTGIVWHPVNGIVPFVNVGPSHYLQTNSMWERFAMCDVLLGISVYTCSCN